MEKEREIVLWEGKPASQISLLRIICVVIIAALFGVFTTLIGKMISIPVVFDIFTVVLVLFAFYRYLIYPEIKASKCNYTITNKAVYCTNSWNDTKVIPLDKIITVDMEYESGERMNLIILQNELSDFDKLMINRGRYYFRDGLGNTGMVFYRIANGEEVIEILEEARRNSRHATESI